MRTKSIPARAAAVLPTLICLTAMTVTAADAGKSAVGGIPLTDSAGRLVRLSDFADRKAVAIVFLSPECPMCNSYAPKLAELGREFAEKGVQWVAVYAADVAPAKSAAHAKEFGLPFPVLIDGRGALAEALGAKVTPEAFVLDKGGAVAYRGRIDDRYAGRLQERAAVTSDDLRDALAAVLAGKAPARAETTAFGCSLERKPAAAAAATGAPTFHRDVEPILQAHCQACHRPSQVAPFSLMTYEQAREWAGDVKEFTARRAMPPWKPAKDGRELVGARRLTDAEIAVLAKWADSGAPRGDPKDAPAARVFADEDWSLGKPDVILEMPEPYKLSAEGRDAFRCFVFPTKFAEEKFVAAVEVKPGNNRVVHHTLLFVDTRGKARAKDGKDGSPGYTAAFGPGFLPVDGGLGGWAPGNIPHRLPDGIGRRLPVGADIVLQIHYHKSGKPETDRTKVGLYFVKGEVKMAEQTVPVASPGINIPAGAENHRVDAVTFVMPRDALAVGVTPHMHLLGRDMTVTATLPDGTAHTLIRIDDWDFNWQDSYYFREPLKLPKGTKVTVTAHYDNSAGNPRNPGNPPKRVTWGEQSTNEMCIGFLHCAVETGYRERLYEPPAIIKWLLEQ